MEVALQQGHTPGPWRVVGANVFRVVSPDAPHLNKPVAQIPPYPWAVICDTDPDSVGGQQAADNAALIAAVPDLLTACRAWRSFDAHFTECDECEAGMECEKRERLLRAAHYAGTAAIARAEGREE